MRTGIAGRRATMLTRMRRAHWSKAKWVFYPDPRLCEKREQLAGAERGRRASDAAEVGFDRIKAFGERHGSREAGALDEEAGLGGNSEVPSRIMDRRRLIGWLKMISIIIPTLNEEHSLPSLLGAIRLQSADHEVIVVDGGSQDRTLDIARDHEVRTLIARRFERRRAVGIVDGWVRLHVLFWLGVSPDRLAAIYISDAGATYSGTPQLALLSPTAMTIRGRGMRKGGRPWFR